MSSNLKKVAFQKKTGWGLGGFCCNMNLMIVSVKLPWAWRGPKQYMRTSASEGKLHYIEMHFICTDTNKMLFFHVVTVLCNALFKSFNKLLYSSRKKKVFHWCWSQKCTISFILCRRPDCRPTVGCFSPTTVLTGPTSGEQIPSPWCWCSCRCCYHRSLLQPLAQCYVAPSFLTYLQYLSKAPEGISVRNSLEFGRTRVLFSDRWTANTSIILLMTQSCGFIYFQFIHKMHNPSLIQSTTLYYL
jgi:hypothetical protein